MSPSEKTQYPGVSGKRDDTISIGVSVNISNANWNIKFTPYPVNYGGIGYTGLKGMIMTMGEMLNGQEVMKSIEAYHDIIIDNTLNTGIPANLVRAIIYEEQTHNKTPNLEGRKYVNSVGPMAINKQHWKAYSRTEMRTPEINIKTGVELLTHSYSKIKEKTVEQLASNYNNQNAISVVTDYGHRVKRFYQWFEEHYND